MSDDGLILRVEHGGVVIEHAGQEARFTVESLAAADPTLVRVSESHITIRGLNGTVAYRIIDELDPTPATLGMIRGRLVYSDLDLAAEPSEKR